MKKLLFSLSMVAVTSLTAQGSDKILAKVNGKPITESQLEEVLKGLPAKYNSVKNNPQFQSQVLNSLINQELLYQEAKKEGIEKNAKVQRQIKEAKEQILINALLEKHLKISKVKVSDKEARAFYEKNKKRFTDANGKQISFEAVKLFIVQSLEQQKRRQLLSASLNRYIEKLKKENKVEILK
ncbi:peptidyl-prolyl cis-trans isomerase domain-containing protein [Desulfurobacterium thermolithotrophum DSM 11699]|uniref:peptidylprolyl isomerase n=1 Tax=Desulfurobacterium thermolithotrophum (strain DSM 11699 / BSA) TaxID=868864 RepID=F0S3V4_DESTD|nr:SurA N-terminal domain-containing protein [Desulfurobacterium thermolithotrophum]ADY73526.1 peptidyl-prolyl cis-trans isomerase domain-containing protein [Desulfurobacterium thermolithotrophum DSM 11699]